MSRLALNFICRNESHIIREMLESAAPVTDLIVAVDTGSTDNTIAIIQAFGDQKDIPTYVFERPFDNFGNSRNYALDKLKDTVLFLGWTLEQTWGLFIDCDETLRISPEFKKTDVDKDLHTVTVYTEASSFQRDIFFHLSQKLWWEGPIHEILTWENTTIITHGPAKNICVQCRQVGASWKARLEEKFLRYARLLSEYVEQGHADFRWVYYTGSSYASAAENCKDKPRQKKWALEAKRCYEWAAKLPVHTVDEKLHLLRRLSMTRMMLDEPGAEIQALLLQAYSLDPRRAEAIADLITWHQTEKRWNSAYIFSSMATKTFHNHLPKGSNIAELEDQLYLWKLLVLHFISCWHLGRKKEGRDIQDVLNACIRQHPEYFTPQDLIYIRSNTSFYLSLKNLLSGINSPCSHRKKALIRL